MRDFILVTLDSCRHDSFLHADTPFFDSLGLTLPGRSHGDCTLPSHHALFSGQLPDSIMWPGKRPWCAPDMPLFFKKIGYQNLGAAGVPYLDPRFGFGGNFDLWKHDTKHPTENMHISGIQENLEALVDAAQENDQPKFVFLNVGETHFPYHNKDERLPYWREMIGKMIWDWSEHSIEMDPKVFAEMHKAQVRQVEWVDEKLSEFAGFWNDPAWFITADHGELFGEHHLAGHGHGSYPEEVTVPVLCNDWDWLRSVTQ